MISPAPASISAAAQPLVIDTNVALDLLVFNEPAHALRIAPLRQGLSEGRYIWLATAAMGEELERVLSYKQLAPRVARYGHTPQTVMQAWHAQAQLRDTAPRARYICKDPDDQIYIDLAVTHRATLLSKDAAVLRLKKRLATLGVRVCTAEEFIAAPSDRPA